MSYDDSLGALEGAKRAVKQIIGRVNWWLDKIGVTAHDDMEVRFAELWRDFDDQRRENKRLAIIAANAGKLEITKGIERRVLRLRWEISETALEYARDPEEVFRFAIQEGMDEFRKWKRERQPKSFGEVAAEAFGEAFANVRRAKEKGELTNPTIGDTV